MKFYEYEVCGERIKIPVATSYSDCAELIRSDQYRHNGRRDGLFRIWIGSLTRTSMGFCFWFRLSQYKGWLSPIARLMLGRYKRYGLMIPPRTKVGYGLYIQHSFGTIVNPTAIIGNNFSVGQYTTVGAAGTDAARIGNNVYVGPGTSIVDDVEIGSYSCVGAGAVVTRDVPPATVVAGVPARPIDTVAKEGYVRNPWPLP